MFRRRIQWGPTSLGPKTTSLSGETVVLARPLELRRQLGAPKRGGALTTDPPPLNGRASRAAKGACGIQQELPIELVEGPERRHPCRGTQVPDTGRNGRKVGVDGGRLNHSSGPLSFWPRRLASEAATTLQSHRRPKQQAISNIATSGQSTIFVYRSSGGGRAAQLPA